MLQQHTLMKFDPATGEQKPYPSHSDQWREWHGKSTAWLFNPWTGARRLACDVGSDPFGNLVLPTGEQIYEIEQFCQGNINNAVGGIASKAKLETIEARYDDLLKRLGVNGHSGAIAEIETLRRKCGLDK